MIRFLSWLLFWLFTLCAVDINVKYSDGLHIKFKGWVTPVLAWINEKRKEGE